MNIIITKSLLDVAESIQRLSRMQHEVISFPLLNIHTIEDPNWSTVENEARAYQAILFTSRYAILSFNRHVKDKPKLHYLYQIPVYAVGGKTAAYALENGFKHVENASSTAQDLAFSLSRKELDPKQPVLYVSGKDVCFDFETFFLIAGIPIQRLIVYKSVGAQHIRMNILAKFSTSWVDAILFYSPKGAQVFTQLTKDYELNLSKITAYCLSKTISERLEGLPFARRRVASNPSEEALMYMLKPSRYRLR